jgi:hypothetical protein
MPMPRAVPYVLAIAIVTAAVALVVAFFDWNWLRAPISNYVSARLGRAFVIEGDLRGEFAMTPLLTAERVTVANTAWGSAPVMAAAVDVQAAFVSDADAASGELPVHFEGAGTIRGSKLAFTGRAATLLALDDDSHPYRVVVDAKSGATHGTFEGTVLPARCCATPIAT